MRRPATRTTKPPQKEIGLHMSAAAYLRRAWPEHLSVYHCPNGEARDAKTAGKLKGMGVLAGVPDFTLHLPQGRVGYIELKTGAGQLSDAQLDFRTKAIASGHGYALCRSLDEVEATVIRWLTVFGLKPRATLMQRRAA